MAAGDQYRVRAAELTAKAKQETSLHLRAELDRLAFSYLLLADQADRNAIPSDVYYETPERKPGT